MSFKKLFMLCFSGAIMMIVLTTMTMIADNKMVVKDNTSVTKAISVVVDVEENQSTEIENNITEENVFNEQTNQVVMKNDEIYTGRITGYGADCAGCSGSGNVSCRTKEGNKFSLVTDGIYYSDDTYGEVRVVAAALTKFPCGTILEVSKDNSESFLAVVMDTGYTMRKAWSNGTIWIDVAFVSENDEGVSSMTGNATYSVQRIGW